MGRVALKPAKAAKRCLQRRAKRGNHRALGRKAAEWQGGFNPLQARARPDNAPPRHHAHWNKKRQCWEPKPPGAPAPDARALRAEPSRVASLSGFERLVLG